MNEDIPILPARLLTRDDFEREVERANKRLPHDIELISDYMMAACRDYRKFGDNDDGFFKAAIVDAMLYGMPVICGHLEKCEQDHANIIAAYSAANSRASMEMSRFKFWQGVAFALASITVLYCCLRTYLWLGPYAGELKIWLDSLV